MSEEEVKEVYAQFGLASYMAQCLERTLATVIVFVQREHSSLKELDEILSAMHKRTMGQLLAKVSAPSGLEDDLDEALRKRNWLIHNYFWDRAADFMSHAGRQKMIQELVETRNLLENCDDALQELCDEKFKQLGITEAKVEEYMRRMERKGA